MQLRFLWPQAKLLILDLTVFIVSQFAWPALRWTPLLVDWALGIDLYFYGLVYSPYPVLVYGK